MMKIGIMQPYFFPYIGYFQLIKSVDIFVVYDNIKYTKKGWINRNRILQNGKEAILSLPLKSDSDSFDIVNRELAADFSRNRLLNRIKGVYGRAPFFEQTLPLIECVMLYGENNLFRFLHHSLTATCKYLGIDTEIRISSGIEIDHGLKNQDRVLALCEALGATTYVNAIGGVELYSKKSFSDKGIELKFIKSKSFEYAQFANDFVSWLSIIDVMMFNSVSAVNEYLNNNFEVV